MSILYFYYFIFSIFLFPAIRGWRLSKSLEFLSIFLIPLFYLIVVFVIRNPLNSTDFLNYQSIYQSINNFEDVVSGHGELLFYYLMYIGRLLGVEYFSVYSALLLFFGALFLKSLYLSKFPVMHKALLLMIIFSSSGFYLLLANAFRQGLSLLVLLTLLLSVSNSKKFYASIAAPALHFSSLIIIGAIFLNKLRLNLFLVSILVLVFVFLVPYFDILVGYRLDKYSEIYIYESTFQSFRLFFDLSCLFFLIYKRAYFSFFWPAIFYICLKLFMYDFAPLMYSRLSYYDLVFGVAVFLNMRDDRKKSWSLPLYFICLAYACTIFSVDSLSSNFESFK